MTLDVSAMMRTQKWGGTMHCHFFYVGGFEASAAEAVVGFRHAGFALGFHFERTSRIMLSHAVTFSGLPLHCAGM